MADLVLTEQQLKDGCKKCIENVQNLLSSAKLLLRNKNSHRFALGLYMYAIEEYGKAAILKSYLRQNKTTYSISGWIFGGGRGPGGRNSHEEKLLRGFEKLPFVCRKLSPVIEIRYNVSKVNQIFTLKKGIFEGEVNVPAGLSGVFQDTTHMPNMEADSILKTACFYVDWNESKKNWHSVMPLDYLDKDQIIYNIDRIKESVAAFDI